MAAVLALSLGLKCLKLSALLSKSKRKHQNEISGTDAIVKHGSTCGIRS